MITADAAFSALLRAFRSSGLAYSILEKIPPSIKNSNFLYSSLLKDNSQIFYISA